MEVAIGHSPSSRATIGLASTTVTDQWRRWRAVSVSGPRCRCSTRPRTRRPTGRLHAYLARNMCNTPEVEINSRLLVGSKDQKDPSTIGQPKKGTIVVIG